MLFDSRKSGCIQSSVTDYALEISQEVAGSNDLPQDLDGDTSFAVFILDMII